MRFHTWSFLLPAALAVALSPALRAGTVLSAPDRALARLMEGNRRYRKNHPRPNPLARPDRRREIARAQKPFAIVLTCSDSRVTPELIMDQRLGDLFVVRVAGNVVDPIVLGSIEYAAANLGPQLLMVLGHQRCGAVSAAVASQGQVEGNVGAIVESVRPAVEKARAQAGEGPESRLVERAIEENVRQVVAQIPQRSPALARLVKEGKLRIVGGVYNLDDDRLVLF